jgi:hypothetical protein
MSLFLFAALALASPQVAPPAAPAVSDEVLVVGRKLQNTQGMIVTNVLTGNSKCKVDKSSGDPRVDKAVCDIAIACIRQKKEGEAFKGCVRDGRQRFLADLSRTLESAGQ